MGLKGIGRTADEMAIRTAAGETDQTLLMRRAGRRQER